MPDHDRLQTGDRGTPSRLSRPGNDRLIAGVCAGIARYFGWSTTGVRIAYAVVSALSAAFPGIFVYGILWLLMPGEPRGPRSFRVR